MEQPIEKKGRDAMAQVVNAIKDKKSLKRKEVNLPFQLIQRNST
ncbi:hypothetical protein [Fictibacillus barbaricus]|uniref:LacI family transcriptional regulator n=1 Tax=Fictibacillus barbaricus TaxID=182136 RepID=A0ABS2ZBR0_9BACL|nr:hypothetical protein [Fictibacillus barbaricus]